MTRREFCRTAALGVAATPGAARAFPIPSGAVVLDDCDPVFRGKEKYDDNLSFFNADGSLRARVTGLNGCQMVGNPHPVAVDLPRGRVWVTEYCGRRLLQFDLNGKPLWETSNVKAYAVAIDPKTGHAWLTMGAPSGKLGEGVTEVYDEIGKSRGVFEGSGYDIVYDRFSNSFWHAGYDLVKVSTAGKSLIRHRAAEWGATSLAIDHATGTVWLGSPFLDETRGKNELLAFDAAGKSLHTIPLDDLWPSRVVVDPRDSGVWVALRNKLLRRYSANGKMEHELKVPAISFDVERRTGNLWVATTTHVQKVTPKGEVLSKVPHKSETKQAWVAAY